MTYAASKSKWLQPITNPINGILETVIEWDIAMNENSVWLLVFQNGVKMYVNSCNINLHTTLN